MSSLATRVGASDESRRALGPLEAFGRALRREIVLAGARRFVTRALVLAGAAGLVDRWLRLGTATLAVLRVALALVLGYELVRAVLRPARARWGALELAAVHDSAPGVPECADSVATLAQLEPRLAAGEEPRALLADAVRRARERLAGIDFAARIDRARGRRERLALAGSLALVALLAGLFPATARIWGARWLLGRASSWPQETHLLVEGLRDGALAVARGEPFELVVRAREGSVVPDGVRLVARIGGQAPLLAKLARFGPNDFRYACAGAARDGRLWLTGGDERLGPIPLVVRDRPRLVELALIGPGAASSERRDALVPGAGELAWPAGTELVLEGRAGEDLADVRLSGAAPGELALERPAPDRFRARWTLRRALALELELRSQATGLLSRPFPLAIGVASDRPPRVTLTRHGVGERVTPAARVPARAIAQDDHGLARISLRLREPGAPGEPGVERWHADLLHEGPQAVLTASEERAGEVPLAELAPAVGSVLSLVAEAEDRCPLGAQIGASPALSLVVVEPAQLLAEIDARLAAARAELRASAEQARALGDEMERAGGPAAEWPGRQRLTERCVWQTERTLGESLRELALNALIDPPAEALLRERALEPLVELVQSELPAQRERLERADPDLGALREGQRRVVAGMRRALAGLEQWDTFVDLVQHLNEVIRLQVEVRDATRGSR